MNCPRCDGMMVPEWVPELDDDWRQEVFDMLRCISCGEIIDPLILLNRKTLETSHVN